MNVFLRRLGGVLVVSVIGGLALLPMSANADPAFYPDAGLFGIENEDGRLLVAAGQGIVDADTGELVVSLPGVADVAEREGGGLWALQGPKLLRITDSGEVIEVADLGAFEEEENPHPALVESNPFDVEDGGRGTAVIADAAGNDLLRVNRHGNIKLLAVFPDGPAPTIPAESVPTSVAVGPDGAYYVGELRGGPAEPGEARIWRVARNANEADCGNTSKCRVVLDGFTTIIDMQFGPDGRLYVAQLDDGGLGAFEQGPPAAQGGSVHACDLDDGDCEEIVSGIPILTAIEFRCDGESEDEGECDSEGDCDGGGEGNGRGNGHDDDDDERCGDQGFTLWGAIWSLVPGQADVVPLE